MIRVNLVCLFLRLRTHKQATNVHLNCHENAIYLENVSIEKKTYVFWQSPPDYGYVIYREKYLKIEVKDKNVFSSDSFNICSETFIKELEVLPEIITNEYNHNIITYSDYTWVDGKQRNRTAEASRQDSKRKRSTINRKKTKWMSLRKRNIPIWEICIGHLF